MLRRALLLALVACAAGCPARVEDPAPPEKAGAPAPSEEPAFTPPAAPEGDLRAAADGNNAFAIDLYKALAAAAPASLVVSPYSVSAALGMTYAGARGETAGEMAKVLHFKLPPERLHPAQGSLLGALVGMRGKERPTLQVANALWGQSGVPFRDDFLALTRANYGAGLREVDFAGNTEAVRQRINEWVNAKTRDRIPELLAPGDLTVRTRLVLTNAVHFKDRWAKPFVEFGKEHPFWVSADASVPRPFMHNGDVWSHFAGDGVNVVLVPYEGWRRTFVLVVPDARTGLRAVEQNLTLSKLNAWIADCTEARVWLQLPEFRVKACLDLAGTLTKMGMPLPFTGGADFTGIGPGELSVSKVIHEALIEVNKEGTEAAAATAVVVGQPVSVPREYRSVTVRADRPFLYLIRDNPTESILFIGRYAGN
ncbi:serpin family protein [bacterium]|nr:serpin family protein [bacterium]